MENGWGGSGRNDGTRGKEGRKKTLKQSSGRNGAGKKMPQVDEEGCTRVGRARVTRPKVREEKEGDPGDPHAAEDDKSVDGASTELYEEGSSDGECEEDAVEETPAELLHKLRGEWGQAKELEVGMRTLGQKKGMAVFDVAVKSEEDAEAKWKAQRGTQRVNKRQRKAREALARAEASLRKAREEREELQLEVEKADGRSQQLGGKGGGPQGDRGGA